MSRVRVSGVIVTHEWGDENYTDYTVRVLRDYKSACVSLSDGGDTNHITSEAWPEIRNQIDAMYDELEQGDE